MSSEVLPVHTGMLPTPENTVYIDVRAPRAYGDDPAKVLAFKGIFTCSPCIRG